MLNHAHPGQSTQFLLEKISRIIFFLNEIINFIYTSVYEDNHEVLKQIKNKPGYLKFSGPLIFKFSVECDFVHRHVTQLLKCC